LENIDVLQYRPALIKALQRDRHEIDTTRKHYAHWLPSADDRILDALNARRSETGHFSDTQAGEAR
jgi:hypothetical protein